MAMTGKSEGRIFRPSGEGLNVTPPMRADDKWRPTGTHLIEHPDRLEVCGCGPRNHLFGPQWAMVDDVEQRVPGSFI